MPKLTIWLGIALILTGLAGYIATGAASITALIPSFLGAIILACGIVSVINDKLRKHVMHASAALAMLAFLGTVGSIRFALYMISVGPEHVDRPGAVIAQSVTAVLCGIYLYFAIRSFINARKSRGTEAG